jgi:hypothetical protein
MKLFTKVLTVLSAYLMVQLLMVGCCSDLEKTYINVHSFRSKLLQGGTEVKDTVKGTSLAIVLDPEYSFISAAQSPPLLNAAFALSCPNPGESGNKHVPTALEISYQGDAPYNDTIPAGTILNNYIKCTVKDFKGERSVEQLLQLYQKEKYAFNQQVTFTLSTPPDNNTVASRAFHFRFTQSDGSVIEVTTRSVYW